MRKKSLADKINHVAKLIQGKSVLVGFSGGVDSTVVLQLARDFCQGVIAVTANSFAIPSHEIDEARTIAAQIGADEHIVVAYNEFEEEGYASNPSNRCYICKKGLFTKLLEIATKKGCDLTLEGTNVSDLDEHRPGFDALKELGILCPLVEAGITKAEVREIARRYNLSVANKPAMTCLSSRIPYGSPITKEKLERISLVEGAIQSFKLFNVLRVRDHNGIARIEIGLNDFKSLLDENIRAKIVDVAKRAGYR